MSLLFWKKKKTGEVIHHSCYDKLPKEHKSFWERTGQTPTHEVDNSGNFGLSLMVGMATGNPMMGTLAGGDFGGALVGSMLHQDSAPAYQASESTDSQPISDTPATEFGGGSGDGAGAGGSWDTGSADTSNITDSSSSTDFSSSDSSSSSDSMSSSSDY